MIETGMKSIWFFVGLLLMIMGALVLLAGILEPHPTTTLGHLRPALWWGLVMIGAGAAFFFPNRKGETKQ